jgi:hypothetical protein
MEHPLIFTRDKETYYYVGQPADYFYDFGMIPISTNACSDVLEKNRFLVAILEYFRDFIILEENALIPKEIIQDIKFHFKDYDSFDLSHWNLMLYEIIDKESADEDFPHLYMSKKQEEENHQTLNNYFDEIIQIFKNHSYSINSHEQLLEFYLSINNVS